MTTIKEFMYPLAIPEPEIPWPVMVNQCITSHVSTQRFEGVEYLDEGGTKKVEIIMRSNSPAVVRCLDCEASPCDCDQPIWNLRYNSPEFGGCWNFQTDIVRDVPSGRTRSVVAKSWAHIPASKRGPIQRITEPAYQFPKAGAPLVLAEHFAETGNPGVVVDVSFDEALAAPTTLAEVARRMYEAALPAGSLDSLMPHLAKEPSLTSVPRAPCALPWCDRPQRADGLDKLHRFCSARCAEYEAKRERFVAEWMAFTSPIGVPAVFCGGMKSELDWADRKRDESVGKLERQWRALRV